MGVLGVEEVLVEWRCCQLGPKTVFSGGGEAAGREAQLLGKRSNAGDHSQVAGGGQRPYRQKEPGPRKLQDPAYCHHGDMGYSWARVPRSRSAGCQHTLTLHKVSGGSLPKLGMLEHSTVW